MDIVREWRDWKLEADQITLVEAEEKRHGIRQKIKQVEILRALGGGALFLGLPGDPATPAPKASKGALAYVHVLSRWHLTFQSLQDDARLPGYGEPAMWNLSAQGGMANIHPSRIIPFRADITASLAAPSGLSTADAFWGESTVAQVLDAVQDSDAARGAFASMLHKARLTRIGIPGLSEAVSMPGGEAAVQARLETIALAESMFNASIYDSGIDGKNAEAITDVTYSFAGAKDILNAYAEFVSAISDIPATRLLGRAPEGMNSSGDSQQKDWEKRIKAMQSLDLEPCMDRLDEFLIPSALGSMPDGVWYEWAPLSTPSGNEVVGQFKTLTEALEKVANMGIMPERALAQSAQNALIESGCLPGLDFALKEIPEEERFGIDPSPEEVGQESNPDAIEEGGDLPADAQDDLNKGT